MTEMIDAMVPRDGVSIVDNGDVHSPDQEETYFLKCWCDDDRHRGIEGMTPSMFPNRDPHLVGVTKYTLYWRVR